MAITTPPTDDSGVLRASLDRPVRDRVLLVLGLVALTPLALSVVELPRRIASIAFLGSELSITLTTDSVLLVLLPVLTCAGVDWVLRGHPDVRAGEVPYLFPFWIAPAFTALTLALLLTRIPVWPVWVFVLFAGIIALGVLMLAEYVGLSPNAGGYAVARLALTAVTYLIAFGLFLLIYSTRERSIITATLCALLAFGLALDLMAPHIVGLRDATVFALVVGLVVGQAMWALNYWNISNWSAGVMLVAVFYVLVGLAQQHFQDSINATVLIEFGVVSLVAVIAAILLAGIR